jgi:hypothetical protein
MKSRQILAIFTLLLAGLLTSCEYEFVVPDVPVIDPEVPIKFSEQIAPIFQQEMPVQHATKQEAHHLI